MFVPFDFQKKYSDELSEKIKYFFDSKSKHSKILFQAPTGAGKTFMCSTVIEHLRDYYSDQKLVFLWISISNGDLEKQTAEKFSRYGLSNIKVFENNQSLDINASDVLCMGWSSLKAKSKSGEEKVANFKKTTEKSISLESQIEVLKQQYGTNFILFIDEAHHTSQSDLSKEIIDMIQPKVTIDITATPKANATDYQDEIKIDNTIARESGVIKQAIILNADLEKEVYISETLLLKKAKEKREVILEKFKLQGLDVNPLVIIQLKNETWEEVEALLQQIGIPENQIGVWLNNARKNIDEISDVVGNTSVISYLICNQAIATGWDCPRAHILVQMLKASEDFSTQVIGRILRTVERKTYQDNDLDNGFIYTILNKEVVEEIENQIKTIHDVQYSLALNTRVVDSINTVNNILAKYHKQYLEKISEENCFVEYISELKQKINTGIRSKLSLLQSEPELEIEIKSGNISSLNVDTLELNDEKLESKKVDPSLMEKYVINTFGVSSYLYRELEKLAAQHQAPISFNLLKLAENKLKELMNEKKVIKSEPYSLQEEHKITTSEKGISYNKSLFLYNGMLYVNKPFSEPENIMIEKMEESSNVQWWFKNFDNGKHGYSLIFTEDGEEKLHFPDFIVKTQNEIIFIETKIKKKEELEFITNNNKYEAFSQKKDMNYKMIFVDTKNRVLFQKTGVNATDIAQYVI